MRRHVMMSDHHRRRHRRHVLGDAVSSSRPVLGLDLQGGISVVLFPVEGTDLVDARTPRSTSSATASTRLGIAEPEVSRQGNTIVVNLPGVKNRAEGRGARRRDRRAAVPAGRADSVADSPVADSPTTTVPARRPRPARATRRPAGATTTAPRGRRRPAPTATTRAGAGARTVATAPIAAVPGARRRPVATGHDVARPTTHRPPPRRDGDHRPRPHDGDTVDDDDQLPPGQTCSDLLTPRAERNAPSRGAGRRSPGRRRELGVCYVLGPTRRSPAGSISTAEAQYDPSTAGWVVDVKFKSNDFVDKVARPTSDKQVAIELDGVVQSAPEDQPGHHRARTCRSAATSARARPRTSRCVLRYGALPVQFDQNKQTVESVSPTLGKDQLPAGIVAGLIGLGLVALYMILFYRLLGLVVCARSRAHRHDLLHARSSYLSTHAGPHAHAGRRHRHHRLGRCHRRLVRRVLRATEGRGPQRARRCVRRSTSGFRAFVPHDRRRRPRLAASARAVLYVLAIGLGARASRSSSGSRPRSTSLLAYCFMHPLVWLMSRRPSAGAHAGRRHRGRARRRRRERVST